MVRQQYEQIMVAVDGSKEAERAFKKAVGTVLRNEGTLIITHIIDTRSLYNFPSFDQVVTDQQFIDQSLKVAQDNLNTYEKWAKKHGVEKIEQVLRYGSPKVEIADTIPKEYGVDLILLGATGLNAMERIFMGSVSEYVTRHAPCDVLIVRTDDEEYDAHEDIIKRNS